MITATVGTLTRTQPVQIGSVLSSREPLGCTIATTCECTEGEPTSGIMVGIRTRKRRLHLPQPSIAGETEPCTDVESTPCDCSPALTPPVVPTIACGLRYSKARYTFNVPFTVSTTTSCAGQYCSCRWTEVKCVTDDALLSPMAYTVTRFVWVAKDVLFCAQSKLTRESEYTWLADSGDIGSVAFCLFEGFGTFQGLGTGLNSFRPNELPWYFVGSLGAMIVEAGGGSFDPEIFNSPDAASVDAYGTIIPPDPDGDFMVTSLFKLGDYCYRGTFRNYFPSPFPGSDPVDDPVECDVRKIGGSWLLTCILEFQLEPETVEFKFTQVYGSEDGDDLVFVLPKQLFFADAQTVILRPDTGTPPFDPPTASDVQTAMLFDLSVPAPYYISPGDVDSEDIVTTYRELSTGYTKLNLIDPAEPARFVLRRTDSIDPTDPSQYVLFNVWLWYNTTTSQPSIMLSSAPPNLSTPQYLPVSYSENPQTYEFEPFYIAGVPVTVTGRAYI